MQTKRKRVKTGTGKPRTCANCYKVRQGQVSIRVCRKAFASLHGVSLKRVELIARQISQDKRITPRAERRGKHTSRPNKICEETRKKIYNHILSFPARTSHYSRKDNIDTKYLSPELNVKRMHQLFLQKFPECANVSFDFYFRYFKLHFNFRFGHPRSDTCQTCDNIEKELCSPATTEEMRVQLGIRKQLHQTRAQSFFDDMKEKTTLATESTDTEVLCFDYQQNMPLPKVPSGDAFYKRQVWVYNFCISSGKLKKHHFYVYDETVGKKTPNEPISFLHHYVSNVLSTDVKILYLFSDNCVSQNKNHALTQYLFYLVQSGRLTNIIHRFPEPGHSFMSCDRAFGLIEKNLRKSDRVFLPTEYANIIKRTSKKFTVVEVDSTMIFTFVDILKGFFLKNPQEVCGKRRAKFFITKNRVFFMATTLLSEALCSVVRVLEH